MTDLSIIVPAYREEKRIAKSILEIGRWLETQDQVVEVLIVVEKSPDRTLEVSRSAVAACEKRDCFKVIDNAVHRGKGYAVRSGMGVAQGKIKMFMDADLSVPLYELDRALQILGENPDVEILTGSRHDGGRVEKKQGLLRRVGSRFYNFGLRFMGLTGIRDTQCGFKFFKGKALDIFRDCKVDGFGFDIELLLLGKKHNCKISQMPVVWYNSEGSSFDPVKDGFRVLLDSFSVWRRLS